MKKTIKSEISKRKFSYLSPLLHIPDKENPVERQRTFVFIYASFGFLIGILLNMLSFIGPQSPFFITINAIHATFILLLLTLYIRKIISAYRAVWMLIASIQIEISIEMIHMASTQGIVMGVPGILGNTTFLGMLLILSIMAYIRYLPYIQTAISIATLVACWQITEDPHIGQMILMLAMAFAILSLMGERLVRDVSWLQKSKKTLLKEQDKVFEFLDMNKEELFMLIKLSRRLKLSDKQKSKLLNLLGEQTKASLLEVATDVVQKKRQNLSALESRKYNLTPYEKEICLMILQGMGVTDIARKLGKNTSAITSARGVIRNKLKLVKTENLKDALLKLVDSEQITATEKSWR